MKYFILDHHENITSVKPGSSAMKTSNQRSKHSTEPIAILTLVSVMGNDVWCPWLALQRVLD